MTNRVVNVFLDTDIGPDCDDTAALAVLLQLCKEGYANLIGITHCTGSPYGLAAIDAICRLFDTEVPVGTCADKRFLCDGPSLCYTPSICKSFPNNFAPYNKQPDATDALVCALKKVPDKSVVFIAIGPQINLGRFLREPETRELMQKKISRIVMMGGCFESSPMFTEWNIEMDIDSARAVIDLWDGALDYCPFEVFGDVLTGSVMSHYPETPVSMAYRLYTNGIMLRPSWDPGTVIAAITDTFSTVEWSAPGFIHVDEDGKTVYENDSIGKHRYLRRIGNNEKTASIIEKYIERATQTMTRRKEPMLIAPSPLFCDPIFDGASDPTIIWNREEKQWWIIYTQRRSIAPQNGVAWVHGTALGVASSDDNGQTWIYRGTLNIEPTEHGQNTYWAPEVMWANGLYHMFVSYITGIPTTWDRPRHIQHYTSNDLWNWKYVSTLDMLGDKAIDACVHPMPKGGWRLYYKNETANSHTQYAESEDLYHWHYRGDATNDCPQEGPNVFELGGELFLIADIWDGLAVYKSIDGMHWLRQEKNIFSGAGMRNQDCNRAHHADVLSFGTHAYLFYFVNPTEHRDAYEENIGDDIRRSVLQVALLVNQDGCLKTVRDEPFEFILPNI